MFNYTKPNGGALLAGANGGAHYGVQFTQGSVLLIHSFHLADPT